MPKVAYAFEEIATKLDLQLYPMHPPQTKALHCTQGALTERLERARVLLFGNIDIKRQSEIASFSSYNPLKAQ